MAADEPEDYGVYIDALAGLSVESAGPALARNSPQADVVLRALAKHTMGKGSRQNSPADADRVMSWLFSVIIYAEQRHRWQLLDEAMRALCRWDAAFDRRSQRATMRDWLGTLSGQAAAVVAAVLRDQPDSAMLIRSLARGTSAHVEGPTAMVVPEDQGDSSSPTADTSDLPHQRRTPGSGLPDALRRNVLTLLYQQAEELGWIELSVAAKSELYNRWTADPVVGGLLLPYLGSEHRVRTWIKDAAMLHFLKALEGRGPTAAFVPRAFRGINEIAVAACGADWSVDPESVALNPDRFIAINGEKSCLVIWGSRRNFRHLLWAAMNAEHEVTEAPVIVVTSYRNDPVSPADHAKQEAIAQRSGIHLVQLVRDLHQRPAPDHGR